MKKLKLFFAACALLLGVSSAMAQKDVTSQYITNATLSQGMNVGWTVDYTGSDSYPHFNSVTQGNNTVGYATEVYAGWNELATTAYSMTQSITLPAGNYRLVNYSFFRQGISYNTDTSKSLAYLKAGEEQVAIKTLGSITAAGYANSQAEGANCFDSKMYRNVVEFTSDGTTPIEIGVYGTFDAAYSWCIVGMFELFDLDDAASVSSPTDVTYAITNPGFEYRDLTGWTTEKSSDDKAFWYMNNDALSGKAGIGWVESYQGGGIPDGRAIKQELTGLDNGLYEVTVYGHLQQGSGSDGFYLYANSDRVAIGSTDQDYSVTTNVTDGNLTIKLATDGCNGNWAAFDKVRMKFYGDPLPAYQALLDAKVATAQALVDGNTIPNAAKTALQIVINENDNVPATFTTIDEFTTAISNIETAYNTYKALETPYAAWQTVKDLADDLAGLTYAETVSGSHTTFTDAISAQNTAAEASTTAGGLNTASAALKTAIKTYMSGATLTFVSELDFTCMIENPSFETGDFTGWTNTGMALQDNASFGKTGTYYAEKWEPADDTKYGVKQTISNLPAGSYIVSAHAKARAVESAKVYAESKEATVTIADSEKDYDVEFVSTGSDVEIGFEAEGNGTAQSWLCVDNFTLTFQGYAATAEEKEALADAITAAEAKTLGFENGEYAPYNNVDALTKLATAKAIDPETATSSAIVTATTALTGATWTANVAEVNAVYDGTFAAATNNGAPAGWTMSNNTLGGEYHSRAFVGDSRLSEFNETNSAFFQRYDGTNSSRGSQYYYGNTTGYTMPLKAATTYRVTVDFTNWGTTDEKPLTLNVDGPSSFNASQTKTSTKNADSGTDSPDQFDMIFTTTVAGDYTIRFQVQGNDDNAHNVVVSNIELKKMPAQSKTITSAGYATFCSPYALDFSKEEDLKAYIVTGTESGSTLALTQVTSVPANTGILLEGPAAEYAIPVVASSATDVSSNKLVGVIDSEVLTAEAGYVLMGSPKVGFYKNNKDFTLTANTAYLPANFAGGGSGARSAYFFRGEITGVANVEAAAEATLKDGKYIEKGKVVIVKNGKKFNATGAQLK